jgi:CHAT domain-containing protein
VAPLGVGDAPGVVLVLPAPLVALPWPAMPSLLGRPVTVAPSAGWWAAASTAPTPVVAGPTVVVAGPRLAHADTEARRVAACHDDAQLLVGGAATVDAVSAALERSSIAHVVAHGSFRHDNPAWSSIELVDGPVTAFQLARLGRTPPCVVLASCHSAVVGELAGDRLDGVATALLGTGTRTVVAAAGLLPDAAATVDAMEHLHRHLAAGAPPAVAVASVAAASDAIAARLLVAVGAG